MALDFIPGFITGQSANINNTVTNLKSGSTDSNSDSFEKTLYAVKKDSEDVRYRADTQSRLEKNRERDDSRNNNDRKDVKEDKKDEVYENKKTKDRDGLATKNKEKSSEAEKSEVNENRSVEHTENEESNQLTDEQIKAVIDNIAEIIGVTPEQVQAALEKTGLSPADLTNMENVNKFIVEAKGLNGPADLLKVPNALEMMSAVKTAVENAALAAETGGVLANAKNTNAEAVFTAETKTEKQADLSGEHVVDQNAGQGASNDRLNTANGGNGENLLGGQQNQGGQNMASGNNTANAGVQDDMTQTPIVVQKGNETVVESGGKIISRTVANTSKAEAENIFNQIAEKMKINFNSKSTEMRISLKPNELGSVIVKIATESGHVTGEIITESAKVKELVEQNLNELKQTLRQQGVDIGELSVSVGSNETDDRMQRFIQEQEKSKSRLNQIMQKIDGEEDGGIAPVNYADENAANGRTVDFSA